MQLSMNLPIAFPKEAYAYGQRSSGEVHGVVLTKPHVVELILDLAGYSHDKDLAQMRLLEPACGHGAFLVPAVGRLMKAARAARVKPSKLAGCVQAFDINEEHVAISRAAIAEVLQQYGASESDATKLTQLDLAQPIDLAIDMGGYHSLPHDAKPVYVAQLASLLRPGTPLLMWQGIGLKPGEISDAFSHDFVIEDSKRKDFVIKRKFFSRKVDGQWYWLRRR